jgi:hypothetical protein
VLCVNHIYTADGVDCHIEDAVEVGERQHRRGVRPRRQLQDPL